MVPVFLLKTHQYRQLKFKVMVPVFPFKTHQYRQLKLKVMVPVFPFQTRQYCQLKRIPVVVVCLTCCMFKVMSLCFL